MINKLLLATDRSSHAEKTIAYALELAKFSRASVVVMHAFSPPPTLHRHGTFALDELTTSLEEDAKELVATVAERFIGVGLTVTALAMEGHPVEAILRAAETEKPDVIVIGSRGENNTMPGVLLGSVAERVVRHSNISVFIVK